ncbi:MmgE/PrpD family protein [Mesorhizobium sp. M7A.F.Ca.US.006.01.1.1]|uniref:MmgE/PrpD family protein n=1 Tax=Mesorhizobium sp. M7A.F.Ca.US.006.01.1.1 TaxID=2496707 RepID=UPI0013E359F4|nr:MmgE/PrpD family protein [Mesorhizobium sp. M7A.F.Ca.US.006.01.1.1]
MNINVTGNPATTRNLADFAVGLRYEDLSPGVIAMAKRCILDSFGCGVFGAQTPWTQAVTRVVNQLGQAQRASAWGQKGKADVLGASFINGTSAQGFELDDCHDQSMSHYGAGVIPSVMACAEDFGDVSGKDMILAVVAGFELGTRIGNTVSPSAFHTGFHPCGLTSTFASAAAIGKLIKLDTDQYVSSLGLAGSQAAGLMAAQFGAMAKRFHSGKASQNGIIAAYCAREGLTGVRDVLEAEYGGFCSSYARDYDLSWATKGLGKDWEILKNGFKRFSSLASSQTSAEALRIIREKHGIRGEDVAKVDIGTTNMVFVHCGWPYKPMDPPETIAAQMNLPYTGAVMLLEGDAFIDQYQTAKLTDPKIMDLADRFTVTVDPELDAMGKDEMRAVRVTVTMKDGNVYKHEQIYRPGHFKNPIPDTALQAKFRDLAGRVISTEAVERIQNIVGNLDREVSPAAALGSALQDVRG